jgi:hypothetical protein
MGIQGEIVKKVTYTHVANAVEALRGFEKNPEWFSMRYWVNECGTTYCLWGTAAKDAGWDDSEIACGSPDDWDVGPKTEAIRKLFLMAVLTAPQVVLVFDSINGLGQFDFNGADLRGANLSGADLDDSNFRGANLEGANLSNASFFCTNFRGANLEGANLSNANFEGADLTDANFEGADLTDTNFSNANLEGAKGI